MKIFLATLASAIVASSVEARLFSSFSESWLGQKERGGWSGSGRILRQREPSGESSGTAFGNIWYSAISTSDSTATVDGKCRMPDGTVVGTSQHHYKSKGKGKSSMSKSRSSSSKDECGEGKGKSSMSKGKGKGSSCAPSMSPSEMPSMDRNPSASPSASPSVAPSVAPSASPTGSPAPSVTASESPTDCDGKSSRCSNSLKKKTMMSSRPKGKTGKSSSKGKSSKNSSKGKGKYEDLEIPACPAETPDESPDEGGNDGSVDTFCPSILDRTVQPEGPVVQEAKIYAIAVEPEPVADLAGVLDNAMLTILASLSGCNVELNLGGGRRVLAETDGDTPVATSDKVTKMEVNNSCLQFNLNESGDGVCTVYTTGVRIYGKEVPDLQKLFNSFQAPIEEFLKENHDVKSFHLLVDELPFKELDDGEDSTGGDDGKDDDKDEDKDDGKEDDEDDKKDDNGVSAVVGPEETRSIASEEGLSAGGFIGLAGAGLIILLLLLLFVRRGKKDKNAARHLEYTDEDENSGFIDEEGEVDSFSDYPSARLAHVVGEDDSQYTGASWGGKSRIRIEPVESIPEDTFSDPIELTQDGVPIGEENPHGLGQSCSSPTCKICDARRQQGASTKFVKNQQYDPNPTSNERDYISSDTVDL